MRPILQRELRFPGMKPSWFHHHGLKMRLDSHDLAEQRMVIKGSAAQVTIHLDTPVQNNRRWRVTWEVRHAIDCFVLGQTTWTDEEFAAAFGIRQDLPTLLGNAWLLDLYGADAASQRSFIRSRAHLNIPCPGTGHDGDPNVSIYLDEDMMNVARQLMGIRPDTAF